MLPEENTQQLNPELEDKQPSVEEDLPEHQKQELIEKSQRLLEVFKANNPEEDDSMDILQKP